jgi:pimeloyl-ACP methyl ester carboxylesterase
MPVIETAVGKVETVIWGAGEDLLLILHASATGPRAYTGLARCLNQPNRCILAPAFAGYGSTRINDATPDDHTARNCAIALEALNAKPASRRFVFGHSMGGLIAILVALDCARRGRPVDALILYEPILHDFLDPASPPDAEALAWDRDIIAQLAKDVHENRPERGLRGFLEAWNEIAWADLPEGVRQQLLANAFNLVRETESMPGQGLGPEAIRDINTPTLFLRGDRSPKFTHLASARAARAIPGAREITLTGYDHMAPLSVPDRVAAKIEAFLTDL